MKSAYITLVGRSAWAVINSYYFMIKEGKCVPDIVVVFAEDIFQHKIPWVLKGLELVNASFQISAKIHTDVVGNAKYVPSGLIVNKKIKELKNEDYEIFLDITPGRKALVSASLISAWKNGVSHILYMAVDEIEDIPLMMKPKRMLHFRDFMVEVKRELSG